MLNKVKFGCAGLFGLATVIIGCLTGVITLLVASLTAFKHFMATEAILSTVGVFIGTGTITVLCCLGFMGICGIIATYLLKDL